MINARKSVKLQIWQEQVKQCFHLKKQVEKKWTRKYFHNEIFKLF